MPSAFRDPKTLAEWIQLDYFRRPRGMRRWRSWTAWATFFACAAAVGAIFFLPRGKTFFQAGPVSSAHAFFNNDCGQCHMESFQTARRLWPGANVHAVPDSACVRCHDGPLHNKQQLESQSCADCHREHRGRVALARLPDESCTGCHADLPVNSRRGAAVEFENVPDFGSHPEFKLWRDGAPTDPGQLRFNHQAHLKPTGTLGPGGKVETLDCANCHRIDGAGRYMQPINYEAHCARCHPLSVQLAGPFGDDDKLQAAVAAFVKAPAPHKEPAVVRAALRERLLRFVQDNPVQGVDHVPPRAIPRPRRLEAVSEKQWVWAKGQLTEVEKLLFGNAQQPHNEDLLFNRPAGCVYCHIPNEERPAGSEDLPVYKKTNVQERWLTHSRFSHETHRMLGCVACHAAPDSARTSDVLMPRIDACQQCHNPKAGVRSDCVECHKYHDRRNGYEESKGRTIAECLGK